MTVDDRNPDIPIDPRARREDYRAARIGATGAIVTVVFLILLIDAFRTDYEVNPLILVALLGVATAMVGVEWRDPRK